MFPFWSVIVLIFLFEIVLIPCFFCFLQMSISRIVLFQIFPFQNCPVSDGSFSWLSFSRFYFSMFVLFPDVFLSDVSCSRFVFFQNWYFHFRFQIYNYQIVPWRNCSLYSLLPRQSCHCSDFLVRIDVFISSFSGYSFSALPCVWFVLLHICHFPVFPFTELALFRKFLFKCFT